jgi:hypothetical protein
MHRQKYATKDYSARLMSIPRIASTVRDGEKIMRTRSFRGIAGRAPMAYREEAQLAYFLRDGWFEKQKDFKVVAHQTYGGRELLEKFWAKVLPGVKEMIDRRRA